MVLDHEDLEYVSSSSTLHLLQIVMFTDAVNVTLTYSLMNFVDKEKLSAPIKSTADKFQLVPEFLKVHITHPI